ncbi:haloacid dehalogenase-like hydrolase [Streptomyces sp. NPDC058686]|uniref:haloacid dehalogenase-like hydrolase n=1 Tax=Streptomyces sp. NPDC058686 TaxID=3346599 RepID=UPI00365917CA
MASSRWAATARPLNDIAADLDARFLAAVEADTALLPGARRLLDTLLDSGIPTALVSASPRPVVSTRY